jgi:hypothetical protein
MAEFRMVQTANYGQMWINFDLVRSIQGTTNPPNGSLLTMWMGPHLPRQPAGGIGGEPAQPRPSYLEAGSIIGASAFTAD